MARIIRCSNCFNPVFEDAVVCPHCNVGRTPRTRPRFLTGRAWAFIFVALALFAAIDSAYLLKEKKRGIVRDQETAIASELLSRHLSREDLVVGKAFTKTPEQRMKVLEKSLPAEQVSMEGFRRLHGWTFVHRTGRFLPGGQVRAIGYDFAVVVNKAGYFYGLAGLVEVIHDGNDHEIYSCRVDATAELGTTYEPGSWRGTRLPGRRGARSDAIPWPPELRDG